MCKTGCTLVIVAVCICTAGISRARRLDVWLLEPARLRQVLQTGLRNEKNPRCGIRLQVRNDLHSVPQQARLQTLLHDVLLRY